MNRPHAQPISSAPVSEVIELPCAIGDELERSLAAVEARLARLADALLQRDLPAIELESSELHRTLAQAVDQFSRQARRGPISPAAAAPACQYQRPGRRAT